jgi:hypothetical protein
MYLDLLVNCELFLSDFNQQRDIFSKCRKVPGIKVYENPSRGCCCVMSGRRKGRYYETSNRLEFITNLMHNFISSIIILHHDPQHVSNIAVLIFRRTIVYLLYLVSSHSVWQHTECDDTRYSKYTIVLLKMSTAMLETC